MSTNTANDAKYKAEFQAEPAYAKSMSLDEYVAMRRVDDGLAELIPGSSVKTDTSSNWLASEL